MIPKIDQIKEFTRRAKISVVEIAEESGYSKEQIGRIFRGLSPFHHRHRKIFENSISIILYKRRRFEAEWEKFCE